MLDKEKLISYDKKVTLVEMDSICDAIFANREVRKPFVLIDRDWIFKQIVKEQTI